MPVVYPFKPHQPYLGPDGLRLAAEAFDAALHSMGEGVCDFSGHRVRRLLARHVMEQALRGYRDPTLLRAGALDSLKRAV
jgi:hypothetical protein